MAPWSVYGVWTMRRTNIYLPEDQLMALRRLGEQRAAPVSELVREAIDAWLAAHGVRVVGEDEWERRFADLMARRREDARGLKPSPGSVDRDVAEAVAEVRRARAARRR